MYSTDYRMETFGNVGEDGNISESLDKMNTGRTNYCETKTKKKDKKSTKGQTPKPNLRPNVFVSLQVFLVE